MIIYAHVRITTHMCVGMCVGMCVELYITAETNLYTGKNTINTIEYRNTTT